jgi:glycolate oxidase
MISDKAYQDLQDALGAENVTREPAVLDGYAWQPLWNEDPDMWVHRPVAVVLPGSTKEVQTVVRLCNQHGLKFKALSTGWGALAGPRCDDVVQLDLRRMDRILEIDEKNMYMVVEPHAVGGQIMAETMKLGLHTHIISSGAASSPLASATSCCGCAPDGIVMSWSSRNVLGVEWVLPNGELLRLGTPGSDCGWFTGDGPGPSLRGIMRGRLGAMGGNGVFTKCALKLYHWPGPPEPEPEGFMLDTDLELPETAKVYLLFFPDRQSLADATHAITLEGIGYNAFKPGMGSLLIVTLPHILKKQGWKKSRGIKSYLAGLRNMFLEILLANTPEELEFQEMVLRDEVAKHGGFLMDAEHVGLAPMIFWTFMLGTSYPVFFKTGGLFITAYGQDEAHHAMVAASADGLPIKERWIEKGGCIDDGAESGIHFMMEESVVSHYEEPWEFDHRNRQHTESIWPMELEFTAMQMERCMESGFPIPPVRAIFSPMQGNYSDLQKSISHGIDPSGAADTTLYTDDAELDLTGLDPELATKMLGLVAKMVWTEEGPPQ